MEIIDQPAVGRIAKLGDLYNLRTDQFLNKSCLKRAGVFPNHQVDTPDTSINVIPTNSLDDKFSSLNLSGDILLSILTGLLRPKGAATFIFEPNTDKNIWAGLAVTVKKVKDEIEIWSDEFLEAINIDSLVPEATHILAGITWGGSAVLTVECPQGHQGDEKNNLLDIVGRAENAVKGHFVDLSNADKMTFTVYSDLDVATKDVCQNFNAAVTLLKRLPTIIQNNRDKSVAVTFHFLEVSVILDSLGMRETIDRTVRLFDDGQVDRCVSIFHEFAVAKIKMDSLIEGIGGEGRYLPLLPEDSAKVFAARGELDMEERNFKEYFKEFLIQFRSGKDDRAIFDHIEGGSRYINGLKGSLLDRLESIAANDFVVFVNAMMSKNVRFVDSIRQLKDALNKSSETFVLFASLKFVDDNPNLWKENKKLFSRLVDDQSTKKSKKCDDVEPKFFIVNCPKAMKTYNVQKCTIQKFQKGKYIETINEQPDEDNCCDSENDPDNGEECSSDGDSETEYDMPDVCLALTTAIKPLNQMATGMVQLQLPCPRFRKNCGTVVHTWICPLCQSDIMYDFRDNFHCGCGYALSHTYKFKCTNKKHGDDFATFPVANLCEHLRKLQPPKEINILILGETGVGKSTWINAFQNYMIYPNFQAALDAGDVQYLIPAKFTVTNEDFNENVISIGQDNNEEGRAGSSATKGPRSYVFRRRDYTIRLIDTPGIGDTAGIEQDKKNFEKILSYLSQYDKIHGICILLKPNNARLTVMFRFCVKELLTHLHKDAVRNIVFCFTNTSGTDYRPGDTYPALKKLLEENRNVQFKLIPDTVYCMDNESFRFLLARQHGIRFSQMEETNAESSWNHSAGEIDRLICIIAKKEPHLTKNTLSLNHARETIVKLTRPLAEITRNIHNNINAIKDYELLLGDNKQNLMDLAKRIHTPQVDIICEPLERPRTVCTGSECTTIVYCGGVRKIDYITHCHNPCYLKGVPTEKVGTEQLIECEAINPQTMQCFECGCKWDIHMHITYDTREVRIEVEDVAIATKIRNEKEAKQVIQAKLKTLEERKDALLKEHQKITQVCAQFGAFLKENAITTYNDSLGEYLEHLIRQEREKAAITRDEKALEDLLKTLYSYRQEVAILNEATSHGLLHHLEPEEIHGLVEQLYQLPLNGKQLQKFVGVADEAYEKCIREQEAVMQNPIVKNKPTKPKINPATVNKSGPNKKTPSKANNNKKQIWK